MGSRTGCVSLFFLFFLSFISFFSSSVLAQDALNPVPPIQEIKTEDAISTPLTDGCPKQCQEVGTDTSEWTQIHSQGELSGCDLPVLFQLNVANPPSEFATIQTCVKGSSTLRRSVSNVVEPRAEESVVLSDNCGAEKATIKTSLITSPAGVVGSASDAAAATELLAQWLENGATCGTTIIFAKSGSTVVGLFVGAEVQKRSASSLVRSSADLINKGTQMIQVCDSGDKQAQTVGLYTVTSINNIAEAQKALKAWSDGKCVSPPKGQGSKKTIDLGILTAAKTKKRSDSIQLRSRMLGIHDYLTPRAVCRSIEVKSGDSCASLAKRCGVTSANFNKFNKAANFCSKLAVKQLVCCNAGTVPDRRPKPKADGTCFTYAITAGDSCYSIGQSYFLTDAEINGFNKNTWGWVGCNRLQVGQRLCLSKGKVPMPKPVTGAVCGPLKPNTGKPSTAKSGWDLAGLNPCPLKACCNGFGFCGTSADFCTNTTVKGGAPGSYKAGSAGCVSNCGTKIVGNTAKPAAFKSVGYFQGYNMGRPCLSMDVTKLTDAKIKTKYTHMHFAFAGLSTAFGATMDPQVKLQFDKFVAMKAPWKKIISFGGWAESTDAATFQRYRDAMKPANREKFASNVLAFVNKYKLDGVDFDWEYPGSTASSNGGSSADGTNYVDFLTLMRKKLGTKKSMSVALPAAYWYLKPFPVAKMAPVVDYIVYMTYDLHGQWDYGTDFNSGCPGGNCLRSHVNKTETYTSLAMITKAGVPASKVIVGVASYGRSFKMAKAGCVGPLCKFTGSFSVSEAEPGACTGSAGYISNAEIRQIAVDAKNGKKGVTAKTWYDKSSDSDIMTWSTKGKGNVNWVAYMADTTKANRVKWARDLNFGGTIDWAVDLQEWFSAKPK